MTKYKLVYFDFAGLAEAIRWIFKYAKVDFEEEKIPFDKWPENKSRFPLGQLPILYENGKEMTQSGPIERYLCQKFGFVSKDPFVQYRSDEVGDILMETRQAFREIYIEQDPTKKESVKNKFLDILPAHFFQISKILCETEGPFIAGDKLTYGDFKIANLIQIYTDMIGDSVLENFPIIKEHLESVLSVKEIREWIEIRPKVSLNT